MDEGCENCNDDLGEQASAVEDYTTPTFKGMMALINPRSSWVARWHQQQIKAQGLYAMKVYGQAKQIEEEYYKE